MKLYYGISIYILMVVASTGIDCEPTTKDEVKTYKNYVQTSLELEKQDKMIINNWTDEKNLKIVNVTSLYRLQVNRHKDHALKKSINKKWNECLRIYKNEVVKPENKYFVEESKCLKIANTADREKTANVHQVEKEIKNWRKSFKYLKNLCIRKHVDELEEADTCLVEYMQRDNFNVTIQRLLVMKLETVGELYNITMKSPIDLERCLKSAFSTFLEDLKIIWQVINKCYVGPTLDLE